MVARAARSSGGIVARTVATERQRGLGLAAAGRRRRTLPQPPPMRYAGALPYYCCCYWLSGATTLSAAWNLPHASITRSNGSSSFSARIASRGMSASSTVDAAAAPPPSEMCGAATDSTEPRPMAESLKFVNSWIEQLSPETPDNLQRSLQRERLAPEANDNRRKRPVFNGHYVPVAPTPLPDPRLVIYSHDVAHGLLGLDAAQVGSDDFLQWVSGNASLSTSWATPYALSIMGTRYYNNCPYGTGDGYGDGRAISIGEVEAPGGGGGAFELQLKGAGTTPFCRGADGRAVLRSSVREFLASEAMYHLGVPTTRALSLVVSDSLRIARPWYSPGLALQLPTPDDPRLAEYSPEQKQQIMLQLRNQKADPNIMVQEPAAIACRVAPSFVRVGHLDLFARRAEKRNLELARAASVIGDSDGGARWRTDTPEWRELERMVWHACYREYRAQAYDPFVGDNDLAGAAATLLTLAADRIAGMVAHWMRVGFAQGNFNADNCLVGGHTMDYGPFGFMEEYIPLFAKWTGSGPHFGFMNQPSAGFTNYKVLVESVVPVICAARNAEDVDAVVKEFVKPTAEKFQAAVDSVFRAKMGFGVDQDIGDDLWELLETMMRKTRTDWTLLFRQLTYVMRDFPDLDSTDYEGMLKVLEGDDSLRDGSSPFYEPLPADSRQDWLSWIEQWRTALASVADSGAAIYERMQTTNPKYILREWMLVDAYNGAAKRQEAELFSLYSLIQRPYEEGSALEEAKYYRRAPEEALKKGGTAFMSCSS